MAEVPLEVALLGAAPPPLYQRIACEALRLQQLGLSVPAIARKLSVTDKTVSKGIVWLLRVTS